MHINPHINEMRAARLAGEAVKSIAERYVVKPSAIYQAFSRQLGGTPMPGPANDNNPKRVTRMTARNGGCSTTSGKMPVTLVRIPTIDGPAGERVAA
jgi:hypothetical protein